MSIQRPALFPSAFAPHLGGVEELTRQLAIEQTRRGMKPLVVTMQWPHDLPALEWVGEVPVRRHPFRLPSARPTDALRWAAREHTTRKSVVDQLEAHGADLVHVQCVSNNALYAHAAARSLGLPLVVSMQGELSMDAGRLYQRSLAMRLAWRRLLDDADAITACSQYVLDEAASWYGRPFGDRGRVVRNGITLGDFQGVSPLQRQRDFILGVGRMVPQKGFDLLIEAFSRIAKVVADVDLVLIGDGFERGRLEALAGNSEARDRIFFLGGLPHEATVRAFAGARVFVLPSRHEPQGIVTLEAMAAGTPCIAAKVGGVPELIQDDVNALLFDGDDSRALAAQLERLLLHPEIAERLTHKAAAGLSSVSWQSITIDYNVTYQNAHEVSVSNRPARRAPRAGTSTTGPRTTPQRPRVAILRGAALNPFEMQAYAPLTDEFDLVAVGTKPASYEVDLLKFPVRLQPTAVPGLAVGPYSRMRRRAPWLPDPDFNLGLERVVGRASLIHAAETVLPVSEQAVRLARRSGASLILTCWENIPFRFEEDYSLRRRKVLVAAATRLFIAVTPSAKNALLEEGVDEQRITVIPAAVDTARFQPAPASTSLKESWGVPADGKVVLFVGCPIQEKDVVGLLRAFRLALKDTGADAYLVIAGAGNQEARLTTAAERLVIGRHLKLIPALSYGNIPAALCSADIVAAPSLPTPYWQERFGIVLAEAMACGAVVLTTDSGSNPDVVGDAAETVPTYDVEALRTSLARLLSDDDLCRSYRKLSRARACDLFSIEVVSERLRGAYRAALDS